MACLHKDSPRSAFGGCSNTAWCIGWRKLQSIDALPWRERVTSDEDFARWQPKNLAAGAKRWSCLQSKEVQAHPLRRYLYSSRKRRASSANKGKIMNGPQAELCRCKFKEIMPTCRVFTLLVVMGRVENSRLVDLNVRQPSKEDEDSACPSTPCLGWLCSCYVAHDVA